jgi:hypothetical protein
MSTSRQIAQARLNNSRLRVSLALHQTHAAQGKPDPASSAGASPSWADCLTTDPALRMLLQTLATWLAKHPLQNAVSMVSLAAREMLRPMAQRNPLGLVLGAAAIGGALVLAKPWRWISVPTLATGLLPQLVAKLVTQLPSVSWIEVLARLLKIDDPRATPL